jgi:uncharacterized membrane protein YgcG
MFTFNSACFTVGNPPSRGEKCLKLRRTLVFNRTRRDSRVLLLCEESERTVSGGQRKSEVTSRVFNVFAGIFSAVFLAQSYHGEFPVDTRAIEGQRLRSEHAGGQGIVSDVNEFLAPSRGSGSLPKIAIWGIKAIAQDMETFMKDDTGLLPGSVVSRVNNMLQKLSTETGYRVFLLMTRDVPIGTDLNSFAREVHESKNGDSNLIVLVLNPKTARAGFYAGPKVGEVLSTTLLSSIANDTYPYNTLQGKYGAAILDVSERLEAAILGKKDPGPPKVEKTEQASSFKTREETKSQRKKYVGVVAALLIISVVAPMAQYFWYQRK